MSNKKAKKKKANKRPAKLVGRKKAAKRGGSKGSSKTALSKVIDNSALKSAVWGGFKYLVARTLVLAFIFVIALTVYLDVSIRKQFEGQKWALPAHVYTRPMELYIGQTIDRSVVQAELDELGYTTRQNLDRVGSYYFSDNNLDIYQREFQFWDGLRPEQKTRIRLRGRQISEIELETPNGDVSSTEIVRLEPRLFGSVSPMGHEDRKLLKLEDVPPVLINGLIANEDRQFYSHFGINPIGIIRAMLRNLRAGRVVQGGSTLTQQLVKNYYLSSAQTYRRKFIEMIMAILLEVHYSKDEILQAYLNEVYLSQAGNRAIHGFALASQYFYGRPLQELELDQIAMLVGINNGPSKYNPIRNPNNATQRRDLVLRTMLEQNVIDDQQFEQATSAGLNISATAQRAAPLSYPAFAGFVRDNLQNDYQQDDIASDGLKIYTTLNPRIQQALEGSVQQELAKIEKNKKIEEGLLQVAAVVIRTDNGEVAAMIGDREATFSGYNRALRARRPVGSLLKPFVYLTALEIPERYTLATPIRDQRLTISQQGSPDWQPQNYDGQEHGSVMLVDALARSYNLATVQLGMQLGVDRVADTVRRVGYHETFSELPSVLLGAVPMTVMDVGQLYLTLASGGFKTPIKGIRSVLSNANEPLSRYALDIEQVVEPEFNMLISYALQEVVRNGTARGVLTGFRYDYGLAGKTGTTDDYRDSWFAGFSGNYLTVVWLGRDDNKPTSLTGASGAAKVWSKVMQQIPQQRLELGFNDDVVSQTVFYSNDPIAADCSLSRSLPIAKISLPLENIPCAERIQYDLINEDERRHFEPREENKARPKKKSFWRRIFG